MNQDHEFVPVCLDHGHMHLDMATDYWICHGWDGEGCPAKIPAEVVGPILRDMRHQDD